MVLYGIDSGFGGGQHVHAVRNRGEAKAVRLIDDRLQSLASKRLSDFDLIEPHLLFPAHHLAALFRALDRKRAPAAAAHRGGIGSLSDCFSRRPNPGSTDLTHANSISLCHRPVIVSRGLNIRTSGNAEMEIDFPGEILIVSMPV